MDRRSLLKSILAAGTLVSGYGAASLAAEESRLTGKQVNLNEFYESNRH